MYFLMNKNRVIAEFDIRPGIIGNVYPITVNEEERLPVGFRNIESWIENRKASKHNAHLRELMAICGCDKNEGFIRTTHAASINDTFWIKTDKEDISWDQVSFYKNEFNEVVSRLAFEGIGLYGIKLSSTSPELSTNGSFRKCWMRENGEIWLYKRGHSLGRNAGLEPYCEVMGAELAGKICKDTVSYHLARLHGELASKCRLFTDETYGYVPYTDINGKDPSPDGMLKFYSEIGAEDGFRRMVVLDSLTFNQDRHTGNHGVLVDNDTLQPVCMAPVFDMNLSLLPYAEKEEFDEIGMKLLEYGPKIGEDFTRIGQLVMTPEIRSDLIGLKGFEFSFQGDEKFPLWRVKKLEEIVNRQIEALLSRDVLFTRDVFVPERMISQTAALPELSGQEKNAELFGRKMEEQGLCQSWCLNECGDHFEVVLYPDPTKDEAVYVDLSAGQIWAEVGGNIKGLADLETDHPELFSCYWEACRQMDFFEIVQEERQERESDELEL